MQHIDVAYSCVGHASELYNNGWTDWDAVWRADSYGYKEPCIRWESRSPTRSALL